MMGHNIQITGTENYPEIVPFTPSYLEHYHKVNEYSFCLSWERALSFSVSPPFWEGGGGEGGAGVNS